VLIVGDSILLGAKAALPAALPGWDVTVDAVESRNISALPGVLANRGAPGGFRVVTIHLCTNYGKGGGFARSIEQTMVTLARVPRVVWVTCVEWSSGQPEANAAIRAAAIRYGNVVVADWAAVARTPGYTWSDGIHLRPEGQQAVARVVAGAVGPP
jgi:lysophospholipase L1-like esterase